MIKLNVVFEIQRVIFRINSCIELYELNQLNKNHPEIIDYLKKKKNAEIARSLLPSQILNEVSKTKSL